MGWKKNFNSLKRRGMAWILTAAMLSSSCLPGTAVYAAEGEDVPVVVAEVQEEPAQEEVTAEEPAAEEPAAEEPPAQEPVVEEEPAAEEPAPQEPAAEEEVTQQEAPATEETEASVTETPTEGTETQSTGEQPSEPKDVTSEEKEIIDVTEELVKSDAAEEDVRKNAVTFRCSEGVTVQVEDKDATNGVAQAKDGKIVFTVSVEDGYVLDRVIVDESKDARTTDQPGEYVIEGIKTDATVVDVIAHKDESAKAGELSAKAGKVAITVSYGENAGILEDAQLVVNEVSAGSDHYKERCAQVQRELEEKVDSFAVLADISILSEGEEIEPEAPVSLQFALNDSSAGATVYVLHFEDSGAVDVKKTEVEKDGQVSVKADSFSEYAVFVEPENLMAHGQQGSTAALYQIESGNDGATLRLFGEGEMPEYEDFSQTPWNGYADGIAHIIIEKGITGIFEKSIDKFSHLKSIHIDNENKYFVENDNVLFANTQRDENGKIHFYPNEDSENGNQFHKNTLMLYPAEKAEDTYEIPVSVSRIYDRAFAGTSHLNQVVLSAKDCQDTGKDAFENAGAFALTVKNSVDVLRASFVSEAVRGGLQSIAFEAPNMLLIDLSEGIQLPAPYGELGAGEYYVDEQQVVYLLNRETQTAKVVYVPEDDTERTIPVSFEAGRAGEEPITWTVETETILVEDMTVEESMDAMNEAGDEYDWGIAAYYVEEANSYDTTKTNDFSLKYQIEFHTNRSFAPNELEIRLPASLLTDRNGNQILPGDIAVPFGEPDAPTPSSNISFNYYYEYDGTGKATNIVFYNYEGLITGTNAVFQVLYKNLNVMELVDDTHWTLTPVVTRLTETPDGSYEVAETRTLPDMTGTVNTSVNLTKVNKKAYVLPGKSYGPGLYTEQQIQAYLKYRSGNAASGEQIDLTNYVYTLWKYEISANATQAYDVYLQEEIDHEGELIGFDVPVTYIPGSTREDGIDTYRLTSYGKDRKYDRTIAAVVRFPRTDDIEGTILKNHIDVTLHPYDGADQDQTKSSEAIWGYKEYEWYYLGGAHSLKKTGGGDYYSWIDVYKAAKATETDLGNFNFTIESTVQDYGGSHYVVEKPEDTLQGPLGERIPGTYYVVNTADDIVYLAPADHKGNTEDAVMLDQDDYYFTSIKVSVADTNYDVFEDKTAVPDENELVGDVVIWGMYAENPTQWVEMGRIDSTAFTVNEKNNCKEASLALGQEAMNRKPFRVRAEHTTSTYSTYCRIDVSIRIKYDSPKFKEMLFNNDNEAKLNLATIDNISALYSIENVPVLGADGKPTGELEKRVIGAGPDGMQYDGGMLDKTKELYPKTVTDGVDIFYREPWRDVRPWRHNATARIHTMDKKAAAFKTGTTINDPKNSRVKQRYVMTAYEGYSVFGQSAINALIGDTNLVKPNRSEVVFYDLLPYGVQFDPSEEIIVGRLNDLRNNSYQRQPKAWDHSGVTLVGEKVDENYKGTGRTMVAFHVAYDGDPSGYSDLPGGGGIWFEGWGVSFGSYYAWQDASDAKGANNVFAYMHEKTDESATPILGTPTSEIHKDNGEDFPSGFDAQDRMFGSDINWDGDTDSYTVLYGKGFVDDDFAMSGQSQLEKSVRANTDRFGTYGTYAEVGVDEGYTYDLTVYNSKSDLANIVVFDILEEAPKRESQTEKTLFDSNYWYGTFDGIVTNSMDKRGIDYVIYYNTSSDESILPSDKGSGGSGSTVGIGAYEVPEGTFWSKHGWQELTDSTDPSTVKAIAVDMSKRVDGSDFMLHNIDSVGFQIKMKAPKYDTNLSNELWAQTVPTGTKRNALNPDAPAKKAYNNGCYYGEIQTAGTPTGIKNPTLTCDATTVELRSTKTLKVVKAFDEKVPEEKANTEFTFTVAENTNTDPNADPILKAFSNKEYTLWEKADAAETGEDIKDGWKQIDKTIVHATNESGQLKLKADQMAFFSNVNKEGNYIVTEKEDVFWETTQDSQSTNNDMIQTETFTNKYRSVVYAQKKVNMASELDLSDVRFTFRLDLWDETDEEWKPYQGPYWKVDAIRTSGVSPNKLGEGETDANGEFEIAADEIFALFVGDIGVQYRLVEIDKTPKGEEPDWEVVGDQEQTGTTELNGTGETITNRYMWRKLLISKEITHQEAEDCNSAFAFQIKGVNVNINSETGEETATEGGLITGKDWYLLDASGNYVEAEADCPYSTKEVDGKNVIGGTIGADGIIVAPIVGNKIQVEKLRAGQTYHVYEVTAADGTSVKVENGAVVEGVGTDYRPLRPMIETKMSEFTMARSMTFTNDYLLRPISVSKMVVTSDGAAAAKEKPFTMMIKVAGEVYAEQAYSVKDSTGKLIDGTFTTDKDGKFTIQDGWTVTFDHVGREGSSYEIYEYEDDTYKQLYPAQETTPGTGNAGAPALGLIGSEGSSETFINGTPGLLLLSKQYVSDGSELANQYYLKMRENVNDTPDTAWTSSQWRNREMVTWTLEVKRDGEWVTWPQAADLTAVPKDKSEAEPVVLKVIDTLNNTNNSVETLALKASDYVPTDGEKVWKVGESLTIEPWKQVVITTLDTQTEYRFTESEDDKNKLYMASECDIESNGYVIIEAKKSEVTGKIQSLPVATLINEIQGKQPSSVIKKAIYGDAQPIPEGSKLVLQVQRYTGTTWEPARGVKYILSSYNGTPGSRTEDETPEGNTELATGNDGKIIILKQANTEGCVKYPKISFTDTLVKLQPVGESWQTGDYRLVELLGESDSEWGRLQGMSQNVGDTTNTITGTIVNSNRMVYAQVRKEIPEDEDDEEATYKFTLNQRIGETAPYETVRGSNITYQVYDADNKYVTEKTTNANGEIELKAGQYAKLPIPDATTWTVSEVDNNPFHLENMETKGDSEKEDKNLAVIHGQAEKVPIYLRAESDGVYIQYKPGTTELANKFTVTLHWSDGSYQTLTSEQYTYEIIKTNTDASIELEFTSNDYSENYPHLRDTIILKPRTVSELVSKFAATGKVQIFTAPKSGDYLVQLWGAKGGNDGQVGGNGGYAEGYIRMQEGDLLYVYVGGLGVGGGDAAGGWNGGGNSGTYGSSGSGGGATDVRLLMAGTGGTAWNNGTNNTYSTPDEYFSDESLHSRILVAGGGGGGGNNKTGGVGGGSNGGTVAETGGAQGATQTEGYAFGRGETRKNDPSVPSTVNNDGGGGGGGWYGGWAANGTTHGIVGDKSAGGGSGHVDEAWISGGTLLAGDQKMPKPDTTSSKQTVLAETETGHATSGYAIISFIG